jgi:citrate synthase
MASKVVPGLEGIAAAETRLSYVDGLAGQLFIGGHPLMELAPNATFEEAAFLLWHDRLPNAAELDALKARFRNGQELPEATQHILEAAAAKQAPVIDALRMACATLSLGDADPDDNSPEAQLTRAEKICAAFPVIVANYVRIRAGKAIVAPRSDYGQAANYLYMMTGEEPHADFVRAVDTYLVTAMDHGMNASTFTGRVIVSTESDLYSAVTGSIGALKGPAHGGAPGPALDMVFEIGTADRADANIRKRLEGGERLMGFGHRVYKVRDPRADVLSQAAERLYDQAGDRTLYDLARAVEETALRLLEEFKPGRNLQTNLEYYTALVLHGVGLSAELFTPTFAVGRVGGWTAHCLEQLSHNRLIRPSSVYTGPKDRLWVPLDQR